MARKTNQTSTLPVSAGGARSLRQARKLDMEALERLPETIRRLLNELNIKLSTVTVAQYYASIARQAREVNGSEYDAEIYTSRKLLELEAVDLDQFAVAYRRDTKRPYPHDESNASVLRYGPADPRRQRHVAGRGRLGVYLQRLQVPEYAT